MIILSSIYFVSHILWYKIEILNSIAFHLQLSPWLAVEIPDLIEKGVVTYKDKSES